MAIRNKEGLTSQSLARLSNKFDDIERSMEDRSKDAVITVLLRSAVLLLTSVPATEQSGEQYESLKTLFNEASTYYSEGKRHETLKTLAKIKPLVTFKR